MTVIQKRITDLFSTDVRGFSIYSCERALPSGVDGLKTSQRKVIYGMLKKFRDQEVKVSIASAGIMEISCYHHGDLEGVIVNMAQDFPGANNIPYLEPIGQFGSRIGPDASASRYIFTKLSSAFRKVFPREDDEILEHLTDDGATIEPRYYLPLIPNLLVNGATGMGTGFASSIMAYNPDDLRNQCLARLKGTKTKPLTPWYRGFTGTIERETDQVTITGVLTVVNTSTIKITELPIGQYTTNYRSVLNSLEDRGIIKSYDDNSSESSTEFVVRVPRELINTQNMESLIKTFKLTAKHTENVTVWLDNGRIRKFDNVDQYVDWFVDFRLSRFEVRRQRWIQLTQDQLVKARERIRFISFYLTRAQWFSETAREDIINRLTEESFQDIESLLDIRLHNLTRDQIQHLTETVKGLEDRLDELNGLTAKDIYIKELTGLKF